MDAITETYHDYRRWISTIVKQFTSQYGGEFAELIGSANLAFINAYRDYKPDRGAFTTYLRLRVREALFATLRKNLSRNNRLPRTEMELNSAGDRSNRFDMEALCEKLSQDAVIAVRLVLDSFYDLEDAPIHERRDVTGALYNMGWSKTRVQQCFQEVREVMG